MVKKAKKEAKVEEVPFGRPTKYKVEFVDLTNYLKHCKAKGDLPSKCGYAVYLRIAESTIQEWGKKHKDFSVSLRALLTISKQTLMNKGLKGKYNSTIAKLILSSDHGMTERLDATSGDKPIDGVLGYDEMKKRFLATEEAGTGLDNRSIKGNNDNSS